MKNVIYLTLLISGIIFSCKNAPQRGEPILAPGYEPTETSAAPSVTPSAEPAQNAAGIWHYTCPNGCAGGAGGASPCEKCGTTLVHNSAYHDSNAAPDVKTTTSSNANVITAGDTQITPVDGPPTNTEPAQNASGIWHYTCPKGCKGGAGSAAPCAVCGATLAHNSAYHN